MMKPLLHPTVIFRVPRFSYQQSMANNWEELKECIKTSSPDFFQVIAAMTFENLLNSDPKIQLTARKYFIRSTYRSTPYALFSGVGAASMGWSNVADIILKRDFKTHSLPDWASRPKLNVPLEKLIADNVLFFTNSTFYVVGEEIRFIQKSENDFEISAVAYDETIIAVLNGCTSPSTL